MNWSEHIPLVTLIAVVFSAGVLYSQHSGLKRELRNLIDKTLPRMHRRLDAEKAWRNWLEGKLEHVLGGRSRIHTSAEGHSADGEDTPP